MSSARQSCSCRTSTRCCEIRNAALRSLRYSRDTLGEVKRASSSSATPELKPDTAAETTPPLLKFSDPVLRAKAVFLHGRVSESGISLLGAGRSEGWV